MDIDCEKTKILVVGVGSPHGDDQVGWRVVEAIESRNLGEATRLRLAGRPIDLLDWLEDVQRLYICDACRGLGVPGDVRSWRWPTQEIADLSWSGTHDLSLPAVLRLADQLGRLPPQLEVWAVEGQESLVQESMSPAVLAAVTPVARAIESEIHSNCEPRSA